MRKRPQRVGGTQNGKSGFDSSSYAEFNQEHDWHLTFDERWPHELFGLPEFGFEGKTWTHE